MDSILRIENLSKEFDGNKAVDNVSFEVKKGEIFGFLGPNGAGKSTTINMLSTIISPTSGNAYVNGFNVLSQKDEVRKSIGLVFQDPSLDERLTAYENLSFHAKLYGIKKAEYRKRIEEVLNLVELWARRNDVVKTFSGGMKRRLEIARGLVHYPSVLFLDEPTIGLDPQTRVHIWDYIMKLKREKQMTIFMTTHYMNEAEYCSRIGIIDYGKLVALDTPDNLKKMIGGDVILMESEDKESLKKELKEKYNFTIEESENTVQIEVEEGEKFLPKLFNELSTKIESIELKKPSLDDVFLHLTGRKIREEEASDRERMKQVLRMRR